MLIYTTSSPDPCAYHNSTVEVVDNCSTAVLCKQIPDVERNGHCFSDGVGRISPQLATMAAASLKHHQDHAINTHQKQQCMPQPSALQFRYKGCKGVLCVDTRLHGLQMQLRPSQIKFECLRSDALEAIRVAEFLPGFMNREIILLLSCHGVKDRVFLGLQAAMTERLNQMLTNPQLALDVLYDIGAHGTVRASWMLLLSVVSAPLFLSHQHNPTPSYLFPPTFSIFSS